jgi:hypothetical protein
MVKKKVVGWWYLPARVPWGFILAAYLLLDRVQAPTWAWVLSSIGFGVYIIGVFHARYSIEVHQQPLFKPTVINKDVLDKVFPPQEEEPPDELIM